MYIYIYIHTHTHTPSLLRTLKLRRTRTSTYIHIHALKGPGHWHVSWRFLNRKSGRRRSQRSDYSSWCEHCMLMCTCLYACVCAYGRIHVHIGRCVLVDVTVSTYTYVYTYKNTHTYTYVYTYKNTHTHTYFNVTSIHTKRVCTHIYKDTSHTCLSLLHNPMDAGSCIPLPTCKSTHRHTYVYTYIRTNRTHVSRKRTHAYGFCIPSMMLHKMIPQGDAVIQCYQGWCMFAFNCNKSN